MMAIQVNSASFHDEGVEPVLDTLQSLAGVNALYLVAMSWLEEPVVANNPTSLCRITVSSHMISIGVAVWTLIIRNAHYRDALVAPPNRSVEYGEDWDVFAEVVPEARGA